MAAVSIPKESRKTEKRYDWATPKAVFDIINRKYGPFTLDPCASAENAKCDTFFTKEQNGLKQSWAGHRVFLNPPYGLELREWAEKAVFERAANRVHSVMLIPPRVGTPWFQDLCEFASEVYFLRGRVAFIDPAGHRTSPMDDNCVIALDPRVVPGSTKFEFWDWKETIRLKLGEEAYRSVGGR